MKKVLRFLTLAVLLAAPWGGYFNQVQAQQSLPYIEGFETMSSADDLTAAGWIMHKSSSGSFLAIETTASNVHSGSKALDIDSWDASTSSDYVIVGLPVVNEPINGLQITFSYKVSTGNVYVGYLTDANDASSFVSLQSFNSSSSYSTNTVDLSAAPNTAARIAIKYLNWYRCYIDDIDVRVLPTCITPTSLAATLTPGSGTIATLNWTAGGTETAWVLEYGTASNFSDATSVNVNGTPTANLTGLTAETQYYARVKADCGGGDVSDWSTTCTFTPSNAYTITVNDGSTTNSYVPVYGYYADATQRSEFIIPAASLASMQYGTINSMKFYANYSFTSTGSFQVYLKEVDEDAFSGTTFYTAGEATIVYTGTVTVSSTEGMTITFSTPFDYEGGNLLVGFYQATGGNYSSSGASFYGVSAAGASISMYSSYAAAQRNFLPKVTFSFTPGAAPTCPKPTGLTLGAITASEAPLTWTAGGSETDWKVYLNGALVATVNTNSYNFTGLTANTDYTFGVAAVCGVDDESTIATVAGHTACGTYAIPYSYGFEDLNDMDCWTVIDVPAHTTIDDGSSITTASARTGNNFFVFTYYDYPDVDPQYMTLISPELTGIANGLHVEFYYLTDGQNSYPETFKVGYSTTNTDLSSFTWVNTVTDVVAADYQLFKANYPANTKYVAVQHLSDDMDYLIIDDISFTEAPDCREPSNIIASNITTTSANLSWTAGGAETAWDIYVTNDNSVVPNDGTTPTYNDVASNTNYPISGLSSATTYYVYVRSACDETTNSDWTMPASFNTECEAISLPYQYDFEDDALPVCWNTIGTSSGWITSSISTTSPQQGSKHFVIQTSNNATGTQYVVLPEVDANYSLDEYEITFYSKLAGNSSTGRTLAVGVMTDPTDASTFVQVGDAFTPTTSYERYKIRLNTYTGSGQYIAIKQVITSASYSADYTYIDNLEVNHIPACFEPTAFANTAVTAHGATFSWTAGNSETAWQLYVSTSASDPADDIADNASGMYAVTTNPYTIASGLDAETDYYAWVRANCGNTDGKSVWVGPVAFTTLVACPAPTGLAVGSITNHTAQVSWTNSGTDNYNVRYRTSANITGGTPETFATSSTPTGWNRYTGLLSEVMGGTALTTSSNWSFSNYYVFPGDYHAKLNIYGTTCKHWLVTPETTLGSNAALGFDLALTDYSSSSAIEFPNGQADDRFVVLITTDNMATWTILREWNNSGSSYVYNNIAPAGQNVVIDLSAYNGETVKIAFYGESTVAVTDEDNDLHIDNVNIGTFVDAGSWTLTTATTNSKTLTDLDAETQYDVQVQDVCGGIDGESTWSATTFTTDIPCPAPTALAYAELKSTQVDLTWTNGGSEDWVVAYKKTSDADFTEVDVATSNVSIESNTVTYTLTGLDAETEYTVKVRDNCEASYPGDGLSEWTSTTTFTTLEACGQPINVTVTDITNNSASVNWTGDAPSFTVKYRIPAYIDGVEESFGTSLPSGWENKTGLLSSVMTGTALSSTTQWSFGTSNGVFDNHARINIYGTSRYGWLITPEVALPAGAALNFDLALTAYSGTGAAATNGTDDRFVVLVTTDNETTWTILHEWNNDGSGDDVYNDIATAGVNVNIDLSAYDGQTVRIAFYGESTVSNADNNLHIDNVAIGTPVAAGAWQSLDPTTATNNSITGLTPETDYEVVVVANCGSEPYPVSDAVSFTTLAGITKDISADQWYAISSPVHNSGNNETFAGVTNLTSGTYDLLYWDQANGTWKTSKPAVITSFTRGQGYIYRRNDAATLTFVGQRNSGNFNSDYLNYSCPDLNLKGFHLVGNPYPVAYTPTVDYYKLSTNGTWTANTASTGSVAVAEGFFIKKASSGYYAFAEPSGAKSAPRSNAATIAFTVSNDDYSDIAYARFADGEGMPKMAHLNTEAPALSIPQGDRRYAIANLDENTESFPLHFSGFGEYTFSLSDNSLGLGYLHLVDRETGADIDMLRQSGYTFNANGNESERFVVLLRPTADANSFVRVSGSRLIVDGEGELQVFDVMGRQLGSAQVSGTTTLDRSSLGIVSAGVYVMRLDGNSQKIVVK